LLINECILYVAKINIILFLFSESSAVKPGGCFTGASTVLTSSGERKKLSDIRIGDEVLTINPTSGLPQFSEVLLFLDRDPNERRTFMTIITASGRRITVTPSHLLLVEQEDGNVEPTFAGKIREGVRLLILPPGAEMLTWDLVTRIEVRIEQGVYAPLTNAGTIIVDEIAVSCYAFINSHALAHIVFSPVRLFHNLRHSALALWQGLRLIRSVETDVVYHPPIQQQPNGIHWYANILYSFAKTALPSYLIYNND
jgi:hedgehog protein